MRDYILFHPRYGDYPISEVATWRLEEIIAGKRSLTGSPLLPEVGELNPALIRKALLVILRELGLADEAVEVAGRRYSGMEIEAALYGSGRARPPFYCSGCPHNTSTRVPEGSEAMAAVGCQGLAAYVMPERRTMLPVNMGGEAMPWLAVEPFVEKPHMFQNMGDGTYSHSGILAIRAAVAAGTRVTFKVLFNDAVAMTGGQPVEMHISPVDMVNQLVSEGVSPVVLMSDDPEKFAGAALPTGVELRHRRNELRQVIAVHARIAKAGREQARRLRSQIELAGIRSPDNARQAQKRFDTQAELLDHDVEGGFLSPVGPERPVDIKGRGLRVLSKGMSAERWLAVLRACLPEEPLRSRLSRAIESPHPHLSAERPLPRPCPNALPGLDRVENRRVGRRPPLRIFISADHAAQPLALALQRGDPGAGVPRLVEGLGVQGGQAPAARRIS